MTEVKPRYLSAYYFSFDATGVDEIDAILEELCSAGSGYHHTEYWADRHDDGNSHIDLIADAAKNAATTITALQSENAKLRSALEGTTGYLLNAKIDIETGAPRRTAVATIEGGLNMARVALGAGEKVKT